MSKTLEIIHALKPVDKTAAKVVGRAPKDDRDWEGFVESNKIARLEKTIDCLRKRLKKREKDFLSTIAKFKAKIYEKTAKSEAIEAVNTVLVSRRDREIEKLKNELKEQEKRYTKALQALSDDVILRAHAHKVFSKDETVNFLKKQHSKEIRALKEINAIYRKELSRMGVEVNPLPIEINNDT